MISKIYHISDIHIRLYKRHKEYNDVFDKLFKYIYDTKDDDSAIVLAGDIVHSKTDMSPELVSIVSKFLKRCADCCPTILIAGNHDFLQNNKGRLDALTPIVDSLNHSNLHYWKDAGVYRLNDVAFSVLSIADKRENWILASDIPDDYKIALYHGPIYGCIDESGRTIGGHGISVDLFDGFDLGICGDIHRFQYMNRSKTVGYSSSLICQSFSEHPTNHGILVWNLKQRKAEFVKIPNDFAHVTVNLVDGVGSIPNDLPKNIRLRIKHESSTPLQIDQFIDKVSAKYNIIELVKMRTNSNNEAVINGDRVLGNSRDVSYQNEVIAEYLRSIDHSITDKDIEDVCMLNVDTNRALNIKPAVRNVVWKPKKLEFSNMFSYGEDNVIDFEQLNGLYGIFSPNTSGKSNLLNILCFSLYDKVPTASKASHIINIHKDVFRCKIQFEMNGIDYFIERIGTKKPDGSVRVDVNFWHYDEHGNEVSLNGEDRDKTNYAIREYVGQYDDFLMTALSTQYDNQSFVEKSQRERKELLYKFLDISIYDDLWRIAKDQSKEYQLLIRQYETSDLRQEKDHLSSSIVQMEFDATELNQELSKVNKIKKEKTDDIIALNKEYIQIDRELNREYIDQNILKFESQIQQAKTELEAIKSQIRNLKDDIRSNTKKVKPVEGDIESVKPEFDVLTNRCNDLNSDIKTLESEISHCQSKADRLSTHEYDPNCKYCVNNDFVKDATTALHMLPELKGKYMRLQIELAHYSGERDLLSLKFSEIDQYQSMYRKLEGMVRDLQLLQEKETSIKYRIKTLTEQMKNQQRKLIEWERNRLQIEKNDEIQRSIKKINDELQVIDKKYDKIQDQIKRKYADIEKTKKQYEDTNQKLNTYIDYLMKYRIYDLYIKAISKEGVPYKILQTILPVIEQEVNVILAQIADFSVRLETIDEKNIHAYIVYDESRSWPVELTSGMERFVLSLAFRQALSEITSLPRPNFMAIDEGFGVLDSENLQSIVRLFNYLKGQYDYLLIISHIDSMRDMVDKQIRIDKVDGFSKIYV